MTIIKKTAAAEAKRAEANNVQREFIGRAWINTAHLKDGTEASVINIQLDNTIDEVVLNGSVKGIQLWPNKKRDGKRDADYRLSILIPKTEEQQ